MKFLNHLAQHLSKRGGVHHRSTLLHHSQQQQRYSFSNFSKFFENNHHHHHHAGCYGNNYLLSRFRVPSRHCYSNPMLGAFVQRSYSTSKNSGKVLGAFVRRSYSTSKNGGKGLLSWYLNMLEAYPIFTKCVSASVIYAAADITSQMITLSPSGSMDFVRTLRMAAFGLLLLGVMQHKWFNFVGRVLPKRDVVTTLKKIAMGQLIFGPIVTSAFFSFNAGLQGENAGEIAARLKRDLVPTCLNGVIFWPVCDFLTYRVVPVHLQPLANSSFAYLWTIYLTYMASLEKASSD